MEKVISQGVLKNERVVVFLHTTTTEASLFELKYDNGNVVRHTIRSYNNHPHTTAAGITDIINDVKTYAPAKRYAMTVGCHGMGWIPSSSSKSRSADQKEYWEYEGVPQTRWFGGFEPEYQTDITTFAQGIQDAGVKLDYIVFDDCYMSTIEVAYDLREVTDYLIASPCEIMIHGMPYDKIGPYMFGDVDYESIANEFYNFYSNYSVMPCGTIAVTKCSELEALAQVMKEINTKYAFDPSLETSLQTMDGYSPTIFFDYGDYVAKLCKDDQELLEKFNGQLERTVPSKYKRHTEYYYTMSKGKIKINTYSGVTISDPSRHSNASQKANTEWYKATHGEAERTLFMYLPWSSNLLSFFQTNIKDMESVIKQGVLKNERVLVFLHTSTTEATLFELTYSDNEVTRETIKSYTNHPHTTAEGITSILNDVIEYAPARNYSMTVGSHGMGWIPTAPSRVRSADQKEYWEYEGVPKTRWFGGFDSPYQTDITTFAQGIQDAGLKFDYILFDDCYMSTIEVAYDLRKVTDHLIASPCEIMIHGMPYDKIGPYMFGEVDYEGIANAFYDFYSNYTLMPCGTIAVTKCYELDNLAEIMKEINVKYTFDPSVIASIQSMDGYSPTIFFDYGDYVAKLCKDSRLLSEFDVQLERTVPSKYKRNTEYYYTMSKGKIKINDYSGVTVSDPSTHSNAIKKTETNWYKATH